MKAKKYLMAFAAIAALSSCTQEEEFISGGKESSYDGNAVTFGTYLGQALQTRAASIGINELKAGPGFGVFAYYTEDADFAENQFFPNFMRNQNVAWDGLAWTYTPLKYWPNNDGHKISFFAYAPYTANAGDTNITELPGIDDEGKPTTSPSNPVIGFKTAEDYKDQIDLLYSDPESTLNVEKQTIDEKVMFNFKHALSRIGFKAMVMVDEVADKGDGAVSGDGSNHTHTLAAGTTVTIKSISFKVADFSKSGKLDLSTGKWNITETGEMTFDFNDKNFIENSNVFVGGAGTSAAAEGETGETTKKSPAVKLLDEYLMLMPSLDKNGASIPVNVEMTVDYTIETLDDDIAGGKIKFDHKITAPFEFIFKQGEAYDFVIHIGLTSVKLDADIYDWKNTDNEIAANRTIYESNNYLGSFRMRLSYETAPVEGSDGKELPDYTAKLTRKDSDGNYVYVIPSSNNLGLALPYTILGWSTTQLGFIEPDQHPSNMYKAGDQITIPHTALKDMILYAVWEADGLN